MTYYSGPAALLVDGYYTARLEIDDFDPEGDPWYATGSVEPSEDVDTARNPGDAEVYLRLQGGWARRARVDSWNPSTRQIRVSGVE